MNLEAIYAILMSQVGHHDAIVDRHRGKASALLAVSAVVLGIMIISMGNFAGFIYENYANNAGEAKMPPTGAIIAIMACGMAGLLGIIVSMFFSVYALSTSDTQQAITSKDFGSDGNVDQDALDAWVEMSDQEAHRELVESCVRALHSRERDAVRIGQKTTIAQAVFLEA